MAMSNKDKTNYKRKYNEDNYVRVGLYLKPEEKETWKNQAELLNMSMNEFIRKSINDCLTTNRNLAEAIPPEDTEKQKNSIDGRA